MPLYIVSSGEGDQKKERLVEANNKASARNFVARDQYAVEVAGQAELFRLAKSGVDIEVATGQAETVEEAEKAPGKAPPPAKDDE